MSVDAIVRNLHYLVAEVRRQVDDAYKALTTKDRKLAKRVVERDDYIDLLKYSIARLCFGEEETEDEPQLARTGAETRRSYFVIAASLEHIADLAVNQANQVAFLTGNPYPVETFHIRRFYNVVSKTLAKVMSAIERKRPRVVQTICDAEIKLDTLYANELKRIIEFMRKPDQDHAALLTFVFILKLYERMGDELLNIGEAILHSLGQERLKYHQWQTFREIISDLLEGGKSYRFEDILETRSGHRIGAVEMADRSAIFKEGFSQKIDEELAKIEMWNSRFPSLVPKILDVKRRGDRSAIVIEYIDGVLLQDVFVNEPDDLVERALSALIRTLYTIWRETMEFEPAKFTALRQLVDRIPAVFSMHPELRELREVRISIGKTARRDLHSLIERASVLAETWRSPFTVWIHGDFNTNNVIYAPHKDTIHYIDVHRSRRGDAAEDIGVFLLSNIRLPIVEPLLRTRLAEINKLVLSAYLKFADEYGDTNAQRRLALAVARNYITSSRFEVDKYRAREFFLRGVGLLEDVVASAGRKNYELDFVWLEI